MIINEDFATAPWTRGWIKYGVRVPPDLDWVAGRNAIGGQFRLLSATEAVVAPLDRVYTQDDDLVCNFFIEEVNVSADWTNARFIFFKNGQSTLYNWVGMILGRRYVGGTYPNHGFFIRVVDKYGVVYSSTYSVTAIAAGDFPAKFWLEWSYDSGLKKITMDIYDSSRVFIETLTLTLPGGIEFEVDEVGERCRDAGGALGVWLEAYVDEVRMIAGIPPTTEGRPFWQGA